MKDENIEIHVYKPLMAAVLAGIIASVLNIFYDVLYRQSTGFNLPELINVSTIIFGTMLVFLVAGSVYAIIDRYTRYAQFIYIILFSLLTVVLGWMALHTHRSDDITLTLQFRKLLLGIIVISGSAASFLVPYLVKHEAIYI